MGITLESHGKFRRSKNFLKRIFDMDLRDILREYGRMGVENLKALTPVDTGKTAEGWYYEISVSDEYASVSWWNNNINDGVPIALIIEYGHVTGWGGYVPPYPYIGEALNPIIEKLEAEIWEDVTG